MLNVQVVTTTAVNIGPLTERSGRSLNGGRGIPVPLVLHDDGTFEGYGGGMDMGAASEKAGSVSVNSEFGGQVVVRATGKIDPGDCSTRPCKPDIMHLSLTGAALPQFDQLHVRGPNLRMDPRYTDKGGVGAVSLDMPAYVGERSEVVLLDAGLIRSVMYVTIFPGQSLPAGTTAPDLGSSLLFSALECRLARNTPPPSPGAGGGSPGGGGGTGGSGGAGGSGPGSGSGGSGSVNPRPYPVNLLISEWIHIDEGIHPPPVINLLETIHIAETTLPPAQINLSETIHTTQAVLMPGQIHINETIHVAEATLPPVQINLTETIHTSETISQ